MSNERIEYQLVTTADTSGAQAEAAALKSVEKATTDVGDAAEETGKKAGFLSLKKTELRRVLSQLTREFPLAGMAARAMINPIVAAFTAAITIFAKAKSALDEWNKAMDEAEARNANRDLMPGIEAKKAALAEAAIAAANFGQSLAALGKGEDAFSIKIKLAIDKLHEFIAAQAEVNSAAQGKEVADVNLAEKLGRVTPEQAIAQRGAIQERYRKIADDLKTKGEQDDLNLKQTELKHASAQAAALESDAAAKRQAAEELKARLASSKANLPGAEKELQLRQEENVKAREALSDTHTEFVASTMGPMPKLVPGPNPVDKAAADAATQAYERQKKLVESYKRDTQEIPRNLLPGMEGDAKIAEGRATANEQRILSLEKEIATLKETLPIRQQGREIAGGLRDQTTREETAGQLADNLKQGQQKQSQLQEQIAHSIEATGSATNAMIQALRAHNAALERTKQQLWGEIDLINSRAAGIRAR